MPEKESCSIEIDNKVRSFCRDLREDYYTVKNLEEKYISLLRLRLIFFGIIFTIVMLFDILVLFGVIPLFSKVPILESIFILGFANSVLIIQFVAHKKFYSSKKVKKGEKEVDNAIEEYRKKFGYLVPRIIEELSCEEIYEYIIDSQKRMDKDFLEYNFYRINRS